MTSPPTVTEVADGLLGALAPLDATAAAALGREPEVVVPDLSPDAFDARREAHRSARLALSRAAPATPGEARLAVVMAERLDATIALDDCGFTRSLVAPLATPAHQVREVFDDLDPAGTGRIAANLAAVPDAMAGWADTLRASLDAGHVAPARTVAALGVQMARWVDPAGDDFYGRLARGRAELERGALQATAATRDFVGFLRSEILPRARASFGAGPDLYAVTSRAFLGDDVDLRETYRWGWEELAAAGREMAAVAGRLGHRTVGAAAAALDADPGRTLTDPGALLAWLEDRLGRVTDGCGLDVPAAVGPAECRLAAATSGVMYYTPPDAGFTRPGRIWWSPPAGGVTHAWREVTTLHHEGVPGHHLQTAVAMAEPGLHPWQRAMAHTHGYVEGWAHYAERLAVELGLLDDPAEHLGMLFGQRWRAARIVIDLGLHLDLPIPAGNGWTGAGRWTPEVGVDVLARASGLEEGGARVEVDRYLGWPGQALAFRVGARLWSEVRSAAERAGAGAAAGPAAAGAAAGGRAFPMGLLRLGSMGLGPLRAITSGGLLGP